MSNSISTTTSEDLVTRSGLDIPVLQSSQRQGDVLVDPISSLDGGAGARISGDGVDVIKAGGGRNAHRLLGEGPVYWRPSTEPGVLGYLTVSAGAQAWLDHVQHGTLGIGEGQYRIVRQREAGSVKDAVRYVAD